MILPLNVDHASEGSRPLVNYLLLAVNVVLFVAAWWRGPELAEWLLDHLGLWRRDGFSASLLSHMFLHKDWLHVLGNMWLLLVIGNPVNQRLGNLRYALLYGVSGVLAGGTWLAVGSGAAAVGASGAVCGVIGAYLFVLPKSRVKVMVWALGIVLALWLVAWYFLVGAPRSTFSLIALFAGVAFVFAVWFGVAAQALASHVSLPEEGLLRLVGFVSVPMLGVWFVGLTMVGDVVALFQDVDTGIAHCAHLGGFVAGVLGAVFLLLTGAVRGTRAEPTLDQVLGLTPFPAEPRRPRVAPITTRRGILAPRKPALTYSAWRAQALSAE